MGCGKGNLPSPIKPNQFRELIASLEGDFCEKFIASLQAPSLFADWFKSVFNADGTLTDEFKAMVCGGVAGTGGDPTTPPVTPPVVVPPVTPPGPVTPPALQPVFLTATRGLPTAVILRWTPSPGATHYYILRYGQVIAIVPANVTQYTDRVPQGHSFTYTVIAVNQQTGQQSAPSNEAYGYTGPFLIGTPSIP